MGVPTKYTTDAIQEMVSGCTGAEAGVSSDMSRGPIGEIQPIAVPYENTGRTTATKERLFLSFLVDIDMVESLDWTKCDVVACSKPGSKIRQPGLK